MNNVIVSSKEKLLYVTITLKRLADFINPVKKTRYEQVLLAVQSGDETELNWLLDECILMQLEAAGERAP